MGEGSQKQAHCYLFKHSKGLNEKLTVVFQIIR